MDALISRQDVIDITWEEPSYTDPLNILSEIRDKIKSLQPEIVRCKDCKYHYKGICPIERYFSLDGFCSRGER